jgi:hypothetical protein
MDYVALVQVVDGLEHLADRLGGVLFGELSLFADAVEQLAAGGQLRNNVPFVLAYQRHVERQREKRPPWTRTTRGT